MNEIRVAILLLIALATATYVVFKQHLTVKKKVQDLLRPENLCRIKAQCPLKESFKHDDDDDDTDTDDDDDDDEPPIASMEECLEALQEGKKCLVEHSDDPMQCVKIIQRGEQCLKDAIARSLYKAGPAVSGIPAMIQSSASPIVPDFMPMIQSSALPSAVPVFIPQPEYVQSSAIPDFMPMMSSALPFPAMTEKGYDEIDYVVAPDAGSNQKVLLDLTKLGLSSDAVVIEPKTLY